MCGAEGEAAIAGYAMSMAITANAPIVDAIAIFFVFILVRALPCALDIYRDGKERLDFPSRQSFQKVKVASGA